jgi:ribosome-binding protein aMBF1 (putative translation factor)
MIEEKCESCGQSAVLTSVDLPGAASFRVCGSCANMAVHAA